MVLVHSVGLDLSYWDQQIAALCGLHDVIAFDLPGHGRSPGSPEDWTVDKAAAVLAGVFRDAGLASAHVVGLSVDGMIAQALALAAPAAVRSLTLIDTASAFSDESRLAMRSRADVARVGGMAAVLRTTLERWFTPATMDQRPDIIDRVSKTLLKDDPMVHAAMWEMIASVDLVKDLHRVVSPTLILVGEHDSSSPPASARQLQQGILRATIHVIPDAAHMTPLEQPKKINKHLLAFLADVA